MDAGISRQPTKRYQRLSIVIPSFNEERTLGQLLDRVLAAQQPLEKEIIVVDDGSSDGSFALAERMAAQHPEIRALRLPRNQGKGAALRKGFAAATGDIILVQDADLEYDPQDYASLIRPILDGVARVVYGSRWLNRHFHAPHPERFWFMAGNWLVTRAANLLYGAHTTDVSTCYKVFDGELLRSLPLRCNGFEFCAEVTALVRKRGEPIWETPIYYSPRSIAEGKKIRYQHGLIFLWTFLRLRFAKTSTAPSASATPNTAGRTPDNTGDATNARASPAP